MLLPAPAPAPEVMTYQLGSNVIAKWRARSWFLSHICEVKGRGADAKYTVYCPIDDKTKSGLTYKDIRPFVESENGSSNLTRAQVVKENMTFFFKGDKVVSPSTWRVRSCDHKRNEFRCVRIKPDNARGPNVDNFSIGYVMEQITEQKELARERGPGF